HLHIPEPGGMNTVTALELAYLRGNYAVSSVLEDWGGDVALTPLHLAAGINDVKKVQKILKYCIPDCLGEYGYTGFNRRTPLHWAAISGSTEALQELLKRKANPNFQDADGRTPLHWAARCNRVESVKYLLEYDADPNIVDNTFMTPIMCAAYSDDLSKEILAALVAKGGNINYSHPTSRDAALHIAMKRGSKETALALLAAGADIMQVNSDGCRPLDCTTSTDLQFAVKRAAGARDVMISYTHTHTEFAKKLRTTLENNHITTWLDLMDPSGIGGGSVWREEIGRGITNASCVVCILTEDYPKSEWCLKELALAKQNGTPVLAISTENVRIGEELQVYLYARQIVPFESAITAIDKTNPRNIMYEYNDVAFARQFRSLLDGVRDEIEKKRQALAKSSDNRSGWAMTDTFMNNKFDDDTTPFVFLASGDVHEEFVRHLYLELNKYCRVYVDHPIEGEKNAATRIQAAQQAILKCQAFIIILSDKNQNETIQDQLAFAEDKGKPILPILLSNPTSYLGLAHQYTLSRNEVYHFAQNLGFTTSVKQLMHGVRKYIPNGKKRTPQTVLSPHALMESQDSIRWSFSSSHANNDM
ncbi:transient receptor potential Ca2 channel (TRP-CC) family protein, partial [Thraustotheca clavata]